MKTFKCDRCSELYSPEEQYPYYSVSKRIKGGRGFQYIDLCPDCYKKLCDFLHVDNKDESGFLE